MADESSGELLTHLHGQFAEHIGGVCCHGVRVGECSFIRNYRSMRRSVSARTKKPTTEKENL
jgi:hypothetical protein